MFNVLIDEFPTTVEVGGVEYAVNTDFRYSLSTMLAFEDITLTEYEKTVIMLHNLFGNIIPENTEEALEKCQWFLNCGAVSEEGEEESRRLFSWSKDANFIMAAFSATHGIDLQSVKMHWWRFYALFMDLGQDTTFCSLTALRKRYYAGKCTKEERVMIRDMGSVFEIPVDREYNLDEQEILEQYRKAKENRNATT